jgi:capsular exopolysaccharide synthesis family protein
LSIGSPPSPFQAPPSGVPAIGNAPTFSYAGQPIPPVPVAKSVPTPMGLLNAFRRRWVLGTFVGLLVAVSAGITVWLLMPAGKHEARGLIELRERDRILELSKNSEDYETYRKNQMFDLKGRELLNRTVNDPAVSSLETIKNVDDPVRLLEESISVTAVAPSKLAVTMKGNNMEDMKTIVDSLMKRYVDEATTIDRRDRMELAKRLETLEMELSADLESMERHLKMLARNTGERGGEMGSGGQDAVLTRILELDRMITNKSDEITQRESELKIAEPQLGWYKITDKSLEELRQSGVPESAIDKLKALKDREFKGRSQLADEVAKNVSKEELDRFKKTILSAAQLPTTQRPDIPEGEITRAINNDARVVKLVAERDLMQKIVDSAKENAPDPKNSPHVQQLVEELQKKEKEVEAKKLAIRTDVVGGIRSLALAELQRKVLVLEDQIAIAKNTRDSYRQEKDALQKTRFNAAESHLEVNQLLKALVPQREFLDKIRFQKAQNRAQTQNDSRVHLREAAQAMPNQNLNKKLLVSGFISFGTFGFTILLVAFLEWRTRRVDGVDQVVDELGMRIIGTVPVFPNRASLKAAAEVGGANWRFALNESINSTRTMLLHTARSQSMQVVMVTSATQGEGKTSITSQLATSMATAGMRTLIVDCDLRNPSIHKLFDLGLTAGVSEILTQDADPTDAIQPTSVPNLWVIPAGQCSNRVVAALAQGHPLETLFNRLRGQFDFVIVDSCPVLPVADALLIGQHVDGVLFSIMQDISQIPKVVLASEKLTQLNIPLLGAVVNGIKQDVYSYGYNYVKQLPA